MGKVCRLRESVHAGAQGRRVRGQGRAGHGLELGQSSRGLGSCGQEATLGPRPEGPGSRDIGPRVPPFGNAPRLWGSAHGHCSGSEADLTGARPRPPRPRPRPHSHIPDPDPEGSGWLSVSLSIG